MKTTKEKTIIIIAGPTASGKSALSLAEAAHCNGIIINADSMQVYREIPILAASPDAADKTVIPHRLYGILSIAETCSAARWRDMAVREIGDAFASGKTPVLVGGTGLYLKALIDGLSPIPSVPESVREAAIADYSRMGGKAFKERLAGVDTEAGERLDENDSQRLIRAWEVYAHTGSPLSFYQKIEREAPPSDWFFDITILLPLREELYRRINHRFDTMLNNGVMDEVKAVHNIPNLNPLLPSLKALGLPHLRDALDGKLSYEEAIEKAKAASRQYAKRQYTWFRNQLPEQSSDRLRVKHITDFGKNTPE